MSATQVPGPLIFEPLFFERVWGGRKLESVYGKSIPARALIGESWEIVDRPEAQSFVREGPWRGRSLHDLWVNERAAVFGDVPDSPRFPLLIKLLDCRERLSLQVHPPTQAAAALNGEPKTECWYIAQADPGAELYLGFNEPITSAEFKAALGNNEPERLISRIAVNPGDTFFIPSGRVHAIGAGNLIVEVQQSSDTTFRVFDWNRADPSGTPRALHIEEALQCIDFSDCAVEASARHGETMVSSEFFILDEWQLEKPPRELAPAGVLAFAFCLSGSFCLGTTRLQPGQLFLLPATADERRVSPISDTARLLRIILP